jgi:hypothetical protein
MKHSKKVVQVPEGEYQALLGLLDPMKKEKILTEQKIAETFKRPGLSALERGAHYQALNRKRRLLNKRIEDKPPIRVLLDQSMKAALPAPTAGIAPAVRPEQQIQEVQQQQQQEEVQQQEVPPAERQIRTRNETVEKYHNLFDKNKLERLRIRVDQYKDYFGINDKGEILADKDKHTTKIKNSDYMKVLEFLTGNIELPKEQIRAINTLVPRLRQDDLVNKLISAEKKKEMEGSGKHTRRFVVDLKTKPIKTSKTRGLARFKPLLWSKIPV